MTKGKELGKVRKKVYDIFKKGKGVMSIGEIRGLTKIKYNTLRGALIALTGLGLIERVGRGQYKLKQSKLNVRSERA